MEKSFAHLQKTDQTEPVSLQSHPVFVDHLQSALLLALQESGRLNLMAYRQAAEALSRQRQNRRKLP